MNLIGGILLIGGWVAAFLAGRDRPPVPPPAWFPDPAKGIGQRLWDGHAWSPFVWPSAVTAERSRRFHGRFWGGWVWIALASLAILTLGSFAFYVTGAVLVIVVTSFLTMIGICWAFYRFVARQLALHDVIGVVPLLCVAVATAGGVILIASNANTSIVGAAGIRTGLLTVGFVEETTKLLVPLTLAAFGRYRDPRAGIAIGLASGFGFAVIEATQYAFSSAVSSGPNLCGGEPTLPTVQTVIQTQVYRIFLVEPLHWLWTGFAVAVTWRLWHLYRSARAQRLAAWPTDASAEAMPGRRAAAGALGAILLVMVLHSLNDSSAGIGCDEPSLAFLSQVLRWALIIVMYVLFKLAARKSAPPQLIGVVSKGWTPHRLHTYTRGRANVDEHT